MTQSTGHSNVLSTNPPGEGRLITNCRRGCSMLVLQEHLIFVMSLHSPETRKPHFHTRGESWNTFNWLHNAHRQRSPQRRRRQTNFLGQFKSLPTPRLQPSYICPISPSTTFMAQKYNGMTRPRVILTSLSLLRLIRWTQTVGPCVQGYHMRPCSSIPPKAITYTIYR
jgi:hypothetical protein